MKHLKIIGWAMVIMVVMMPAGAGADGLGNARLSLLNGDVQIQSEDSPEWFPASVNMPLREGDRIWAPEGARAEVQLAGGTQIRLDELSSLDILNISRDSSQFYLAEGWAYLHFRGSRSNGLVQIDTPVSSLRAFDRASFGLDVFGNGDTALSVFQGIAHAETRSGRTRVTEGNALEIGDGYADLMPLGRENEWERWNLDRDRRFDQRRHSSRYLPDELDAYAGDFDENGKWISVRDYGNVWIPTVQVSAGWSPYRNGRWSWIGNDYVWVGYEPWGWAPYHYGRWDHSEAIGWFWIPPEKGDVFWGPGYVGWVHTPTYVAWIPLAPRETYYGHGHYGKHSVNLSKVTINTLIVKDRYRHARVHNAVTTVHHDTFVKGKQVDFKVKENPFLREKIHAGRPDIRPERESRMTVIRDTPKTKEPPRKVSEMKVRDIRASRPLVKERDKSAFSDGKSDQKMKVQTLDKPRERRKDRSEERSKEHDRKGRGVERPQAEEKKRDAAPAEKKQSDEKKDRPGMPGKEQQGGAVQTPSVDSSLPKGKPQSERQDQRPVQQKKEEVKPERMKKEYKAPEGLPDQPKMRQEKSEPVQNREMKREDRQQRPQEKRPDSHGKPLDKQDLKQDQQKDKDKEDKKDKRKKAPDEKDGKQSGEGSQPKPLERGFPAPR